MRGLCVWGLPRQAFWPARRWWVARAPAAAKDIVLKMAVPDWPPTRIMQDLANEKYKAKSGNNVKLEADFIPWPVYYERLAASLTSGEKKYQMAVSDSQWLGAFVEGGYYMQIDKFIKDDPEWQKVFKDLNQNVVWAYSTYPYKSDNHYGFPQMPDVLVAYYRKDVFCDPGEQAGLPGQVRQEAALHRRGDGRRRLGPGQDLRRVLPRKQGREAGRQAAGRRLLRHRVSGRQGLRLRDHAGQRLHLAARRQHLGRDQGARGQGRGCGQLARGDQGVSTTISRLIQYMPPVAKTGTMGIAQIDELFRAGKVAYEIEWIGFAESTINPQTSTVADKVAFAQSPGLRGADGKLVRWNNIGGQPFVLTTWNSEEVTKESLEFCKWWLSTDTQKEFAKRGGQSALKIGLHDTGIPDLPALEPGLGAEPRMAEGRLARAGFL